MKSEQINELATALSKAQGEIDGAKKDSKGNYGKFADLASVFEAIKAPFLKHGLSIVQTTDVSADGIMLTTTLLHSSGQWIEGYYPINPLKNDPQGIGSAMSYGRRYALSAIAGISQIDDDGEAAQGRNSHVIESIKMPDPYKYNPNGPGVDMGMSDLKSRAADNARVFREAQNKEGGPIDTPSCPVCKSKMSPGKYPDKNGFKLPYCVPCYKKKQDQKNDMGNIPF